MKQKKIKKALKASCSEAFKSGRPKSNRTEFFFLETVYLDLCPDKVWGFSIFFILHTSRRYLGTAALKTAQEKNTLSLALSVPVRRNMRNAKHKHLVLRKFYLVCLFQKPLNSCARCSTSTFWFPPPGLLKDRN